MLKGSYEMTKITMNEDIMCIIKPSEIMKSRWEYAGNWMSNAFAFTWFL